MREQRFKPYSVSTLDGEGFVIGIQKEDGTVMSITGASEMLNEQQATITHLEKVNGINFAKRRLLEQDNLILRKENEQLRKQLQMQKKKIEKLEDTIYLLTP